VWLKFLINPRSYERLKSILVGGLVLDAFFATFFAIFLTFQSHFANTMSQLNDNFLSPICLYVGFESLYRLSFPHLSRFRNGIFTS